VARVIAVVGGSGGVGASLFAGALAAVAAAPDRPSLLIDLDVTGGGIDVVLGMEAAPGARWSGLRLAGGELDAQVLLDGLVPWAGCRVLAADVIEVDAAAVAQVLDAVDLALDTVVIDLPRVPGPARDAALARSDLVVVIARGDVAGVVAAHAQVQSLPAVPIGVLAHRGEIDARHVVDLVGAPLLGRLPWRPGARPDPARLPRALRAVAGGVLAGLVLEGVPA
jgi:MinD-like ATPase involved in chromosome partitioning or flagellar assembly